MLCQDAVLHELKEGILIPSHSSSLRQMVFFAVENEWTTVFQCVFLIGCQYKWLNDESGIGFAHVFRQIECELAFKLVAFDRGVLDVRLHTLSCGCDGGGFDGHIDVEVHVDLLSSVDLLQDRIAQRIIEKEGSCLRNGDFVVAAVVGECFAHDSGRENSSFMNRAHE